VAFIPGEAGEIKGGRGGLLEAGRPGEEQRVEQNNHNILESGNQCHGTIRQAEAGLRLHEDPGDTVRREDAEGPGEIAMSKITVKEVKPAEGDNQPTVITDDTGAKMSGFDTALKDVRPGDVIDVELKPKGKYLNIVSFKVLEKSQALRQAQGERDGESPGQEYTRRVEMDIDARYRVAALECANALAAAGKVTDLKDVRLWADQFYCWLAEKPAPKVNGGSPTPAVVKGEPPQVRGERPLAPADATKPSENIPQIIPATQGPVRPPVEGAGEIGGNAKAATPASQGRGERPLAPTDADKDFAGLGRTEAEKAAGNSLDFPTVGDFYAACLKQKGFNRTETDGYLKAKYDLSKPAGRAEAWVRISGLPGKADSSRVEPREAK